MLVDAVLEVVKKGIMFGPLYGKLGLMNALLILFLLLVAVALLERNTTDIASREKCIDCVVSIKNNVID